MQAYISVYYIYSYIHACIQQHNTAEQRRADQNRTYILNVCNQDVGSKETGCNRLDCHHRETFCTGVGLAGTPGLPKLASTPLHTRRPALRLAQLRKQIQRDPASRRVQPRVPRHRLVRDKLDYQPQCCCGVHPPGAARACHNSVGGQDLLTRNHPTGVALGSHILLSKLNVCPSARKCNHPAPHPRK